MTSAPKTPNRPAHEYKIKLHVRCAVVKPQSANYRFGQDAQQRECRAIEPGVVKQDHRGLMLKGNVKAANC